MAQLTPHLSLHLHYFVLWLHRREELRARTQAHMQAPDGRVGIRRYALNARSPCPAFESVRSLGHARRALDRRAHTESYALRVMLGE